jgi:hypothetical protein
MSNLYPFHVDPPAIADSGDEEAIQVRFRARVKMLAAAPIRVVATPNAGKRTAWSAMKAKREGLTPGWPDVQVLWAGGRADIEFKARSGSLKPEQIDALNWLHRNDHPCGVFRSVDTAIAFLRRCGAPLTEAAA